MAKSPTVWFRKQTGWYMTTVDGTQHKLSKDKAEAQQKFYKLMGSDRKPAVRAGTTCRRLCDLYLVKTRPDKGDARHAVQLGHLKKFCERFGHRDPASLKAHEVNDWLDSLSRKPRKADAGPVPLGPSTKAAVVMTVKAVMNWAASEDRLAENPLAKLRRRKVARRERVLSADERRRAAAAVSPHFRDFLAVLEQTGCRPFSEAAKLTAGGIDWENGSALLKAHKTADKGKRRVVFFPPALLARLAELAARHPAGPLLRNRLGNAWTRSNVGKYLDRVGRGLGVEPFVAYSYRASYITDALIKGVPVEVVAELVGTSAKMIWQHYASVARRPDALKAAALKAVS